MAIDEDLANRVREVLGRTELPVREQRMFGGLAFMVRGHMACGILGEDLMVRVGKDGYDEALDQPNARVMDFTGRPSTGIVFVDAEGTTADDDLAAWVGRGLDHVATLPPR
ncbi:TfoX/Sxy family protein [Salsipaludibacter albus]|uniref:TfoX/Sxy family protein n=1 Tax=Salsipaludibacter albus TaxID=2849650 RepID=UPI001EE4C480|nr:TfoX/Sxy family protein [Salsipaludibacter albus]MBY5163617.1 TfoX/Sxy family protein [Salsipaludibacter albus]